MRRLVAALHAPPSPGMLAKLLTESFEGPAWHGSSVMSALRGLHASDAAWRPAAGRPNRWEIALHLAYTRHAVIRRIDSTYSQRFPRALRKQWWPRTPAVESETTWASDRELLRVFQKRLLESVGRLSQRELAGRRRGRRYTTAEELLGVAMHDAYHSGQIRLINALREGIRSR